MMGRCKWSTTNVWNRFFAEIDSHLVISPLEVEKWEVDDTFKGKDYSGRSLALTSRGYSDVSYSAQIQFIRGERAGAVFSQQRVLGLRS